MWGEQDTKRKPSSPSFPPFPLCSASAPFTWLCTNTTIPGHPETHGSHACNVIGVLRPPHADPCLWRLCPWRGTKCPGILPPAYSINVLRGLLGPAGRSQATCAELGERLPLCLQYGQSRRNCRHDLENLILPKSSKPSLLRCHD